LTPGNVEFVQVVTSWVASVGAFATLVIRDERRLKKPALEHAWPPASRDAAILGVFLFGAAYAVLAVLIHFARTRRTLRGAAIGLFWGVCVLLLDVGAAMGAEVAIDWLGI
jgi:hypothetical protein